MEFGNSEEKHVIYTIFLGLTELAGIEQHFLMVHWSTCLMNPTKQVHSMELACPEFITSGFLLGHTPYDI